MVSEDFFTEHIFSWGSRTSAPSWRPRGHGLHYAIFLLFGSLMLFQLNYTAWIFEYVATYATACSLLQPCEPLLLVMALQACCSWGKRGEFVRYGKPLQYTLAVESFCSCHTVLFGTVSVFLIWFTAIFFRGLTEGYAALWTANSWMTLARKLLPCFHFSSARSQVRGSSIY